MLKKFLRDSAVYGSAKMLSRGVQFLLVPLYTRVLAPSDYGIIDMMMIVAAIARPVLTLEIPQGMARSYAETVDSIERRAYASTTLWFTAGAAAALALIASFGADLSVWVLGPGTRESFRVGTLAISTQFLFFTVLNQLRWDLRPGMHGLTSVLFTVVSAGTAVVLVVGLKTGVIGVFYGQLAGYTVASAFAVSASRDRYRLLFDVQKCREMLAFSGPLVFSVIGAYVSTLADRVAIKSLLGLDALGVYGIGARVASTVGLLLSGFTAALTPLIFHRYREAETPADLARLFRIFLLLVLPVLLGFTIFADEIVHVLATPAYYGASDVVPLLTLAALFTGMNIFAPGMEISRKTRLIAIIMVLTAGENVGLNAWLVPSFGIRGASIATLASAATGFALYMVASQRHYPVPHRWPRLAGASAVAAAAAVGAAALTGLTSGVAEALLAKTAVWLVACAGFAAILLDRRDLRILTDRLRGAHRRGRS